MRVCARMSESPRAQRVAQRHQVNPRHHQANQTASAILRELTTPPRELDPTAPPLFQLTGSTVSTLTTGNTDQTGLNDEEEDVDFMGGGGGGFDDDMGEEGIWGEEGNGGEEEEEVLLPPLPPLKSVFDCGYVHQTQSGWECMWCGKSFVGRHSTRALRHVMKMTKNDVGVCSAAIPDKYLKRYEALFRCLSQRSAAQKRSHEEKHDSVAVSQDASVATLLAKRGIMVSLPPIPQSLGTKSSFASFSVNDGASVTSSSSKTSSYPKRKSPFPLPSMQPSISASIQNMGDIRKSNNATLEMAIADFFHSENIPDAVVDSPRFARLVRVCRLVGDDFVIPNRKKIGGELLDLNYETTYKSNKEKLLKEARVFGLAFLGDGATIKRMPLMNVLAMTATVSPMTIEIQDCSSHMEEGGKKDAVYVASLFEEKVGEFDPQNQLTDVFFFDGASNVQKAGEVLMAKYPRSFSFHGGEHVVSLFFSSIAKLKPIKVCH